MLYRKVWRYNRDNQK